MHRYALILAALLLAVPLYSQDDHGASAVVKPLSSSRM